jgi:hypothetical protein
MLLLLVSERQPVRWIGFTSGSDLCRHSSRPLDRQLWTPPVVDRAVHRIQTGVLVGVFSFCALCGSLCS